MAYLNLERLLSRVTLETANLEMCWLWLRHWQRFPRSRRAGATAASRLSALQAALDELADLRGHIEATIVPEPL